MKKERVNIAEVNKGLSLNEGIQQWIKRGTELNEGNPWLTSTRREDSLRRYLGFHKALGMNDVLIGWIGFGIPLHFIHGKAPEPLAFRNHASAAEESEFIDKEHAASVADGSYVEVSREELLGVCPLQVVKHPVSGKRRLVQDLRWINGHLPNVQFRMESLFNELGDIVKLQDKLLTTDIAKAYYCLAMHPDARRYLGWEWKGKYYMPTCLVFGLSTAPRVFTKVMRPMMAFFRSLGVRVLGMIDDYLWAAQKERINDVKAAVLTVLPQLGWSLNEKCELEPQDEVLMLGMLINAKEFVVKAPEKKVNATLHDIKAALWKRENQQPITLQSVQRITGRLMSMMLAYSGMRVFTRDLYRVIAIASEANEIRKLRGERGVYVVVLDSKAVDDLLFWQQRLLTHNGHRINNRDEQVQFVLWSDASDLGYGGEVAGVESAVGAARVAAAERQVPDEPVEQMVYGELPTCEIQHSSTRRELVGLLLVASNPKILKQITGKRVLIIMDSVPALRNLIKGGGPVDNLNQAVREWTRFCEAHHIEAEYEWVERAGNWRADQASKLMHQQHSWKKKEMEAQVRDRLSLFKATQWKKRSNHFLYGKVPVFTPMFHQVDARLEMIMSQLEEAILVMPQWPAGGMTDWYRRAVDHSIARETLGKASQWYKEVPLTGHDDVLEAVWILGKRGKKKYEDSEAQLKR